MDQRRLCGIGGDIFLAGAKQHLDHIGDAGINIVLGKFQPARHAQELVQRDRATRIIQALPFGHVRRGVDVDLSLAQEDADKGLGDAFGLRPG